MSEKIEELQRDIEELKSFENQAKRQKCKDILAIEIRRLVSEVLKLKEQSKDSIPLSTSSNSTGSLSRRYEVKLSNYAWDQTDKFVKFYITLKNVQDIPAENVKGKFSPKSMEIIIEDLDGKDHALRINNFLKPVNPDQCTWRVKKDMVIVSAAKTSTDNWSHVTEWEKKANDLKMPNLGAEKSDPSEGLMSMMKNMYDKGDDEMKRTIAKAWTESQEKNRFSHLS
ncbi:hypothetical protein JTB14_025880 [Gonioctena quinquepunctata]|nr:hypothetical protein JTB14_025880 [Gonioctena quinquepunctata]